MKNKKTNVVCRYYYLNMVCVTLLSICLIFFVVPVSFAEETSECMKEKKDMESLDGQIKERGEEYQDEIKTAEEGLKTDQTQVANNKDAIAALKKADEEQRSSETEDKRLLGEIGSINTQLKDSQLSNEKKAEFQEKKNKLIASHRTAAETRRQKTDASEKLQKDNPNAAEIYGRVKKNDATIAENKKNIQDLQNSEDFKRLQVFQRYSSQITGTRSQREELKKLSDSNIKTGKLGASGAYETLLDKKCIAELCAVGKPSADVKTACEAQIKAAEAAAAEVRKQMLELTYLEQQKNAQSTFDVTTPFSLSGKQPRKKLIYVTNKLADWMITLVGSLAVTTLIIGGGMMIISGGDETRLETGKTIFTYSLIGLVVTLLAYGIVAFLQSLFY